MEIESLHQRSRGEGISTMMFLDIWSWYKPMDVFGYYGISSTVFSHSSEFHQDCLLFFFFCVGLWSCFKCPLICKLLPSSESRSWGGEILLWRGRVFYQHVACAHEEWLVNGRVVTLANQLWLENPPWIIFPFKHHFSIEDVQLPCLITSGYPLLTSSEVWFWRVRPPESICVQMMEHYIKAPPKCWTL